MQVVDHQEKIIKIYKDLQKNYITYEQNKKLDIKSVQM